MTGNKLDPAKIILVLIVLLSFGTVLGVIGYSLSLKNSPPVAVQPTVEPTVALMPSPESIIELTATPEPTPIPTPQLGKDANGWYIIHDEENGYEYKYPPEYVENNYDMQINVESTDTSYTNLPLKCPLTNFEGWSKEFEGKKITVNNTVYCEYKAAEGTAGTTFESSRYITVKNKKLYTIDFTVALPHCYSLCQFNDCEKDPAVISCEKSNKEKTATVQKILSTFKFIEK